MKPQKKAELIKILGQKRELLEKMRQMTEQIKTELQQDSIEAFAEVVRLRQQIIAQIDGLTKAEQEIDAGDDIEVMTLKNEIRGIVAQTLEQDEQNTALAQQKLQQYREQIRNLNQTKKGVGGYTRPMNKEDAFFVDANK